MSNQYDKLFEPDGTGEGTVPYHTPTSPAASDLADDWTEQTQIAQLIAEFLKKRPQAHTVKELVAILKLTEVSIADTVENRNHLWFLDEIERLLERLAADNDQENLIIPPAYVSETQSLWRDRIHIQELFSASPLSTEQWLQANEHSVLARTNPQAPYFQRTYHQLRWLQYLLTVKKEKHWIWTYDFKLLRKRSIKEWTDSKLQRAETALRSRRIMVLSALIVSDDIDAHDEVAIDGIWRALHSIQQIVNRLLETMNTIIEKNSTDERFVAFRHLEELALDEESLQDVHVDSLNTLWQQCGLSFKIPKNDRGEAWGNYQAARKLVQQKIAYLREQEQLVILKAWEQIMYGS